MTKKRIWPLLLFMLGMCLVYGSEKDVVFASLVNPKVTYRTRVERGGWQKAARSNGQISGTVGQGKAIEGIQINLNTGNAEADEGEILYRSHVQGTGWESSFRTDGEVSGAKNGGKRLEAIQIKLTGKVAEAFDIYYRVHVEGFGWLDWAKNGANAGTAGYSYRIEAIAVQLVKKGTAAPGKIASPFTALDFGKTVNAAEKENAKRVNKLRRSKGQTLLTWNNKLYAAAKTRTKELVRLFGHTRPNGSRYNTVAKEVGYVKRVGENAAMNANFKGGLTSRAGAVLYQQWYKSEGHYDNMLGYLYDEFAVAIYKKNGAIYGIQLFGATDD